MKKEMDIVALGELLIDFTEAGTGADGMKLFEQNPGGAPANLLTAASHMGYRTAFIGKVGTDMHGAFLKKTLEKEGIDTRALVEDPATFTTLAFVEINENGERNFSFARKPGADARPAQGRAGSGAAVRLPDFSFRFPVPCRRQAFPERDMGSGRCLAKAAGALISYDPNYSAAAVGSIRKKRQKG